jgi:hypothetical protein
MTIDRFTVIRFIMGLKNLTKKTSLPVAGFAIGSPKVTSIRQIEVATMQYPWINTATQEVPCGFLNT